MAKLDTKVEKSRKQMKERKNRAKKIRGVKKTKVGDAAKKKRDSHRHELVFMEQYNPAPCSFISPFLLFSIELHLVLSLFSSFLSIHLNFVFWTYLLLWRFNLKMNSMKGWVAGEGNAGKEVGGR
ncbi:hypothetical protein GQ457_10G022100 [Hibiscus cannabinus]